MNGLRTMPTRAGRSACPPRGQGLGVARRIEVELTPRAVERVAARVAELLRKGKEIDKPELISAGELARRLRVERPWVYRHRHLLGGMRIGDGPKAPWRFDYGAAVAALKCHQAQSEKDGDR